MTAKKAVTIIAIFGPFAILFGVFLAANESPTPTTPASTTKAMQKHLSPLDAAQNRLNECITHEVRRGHYVETEAEHTDHLRLLRDHCAREQADWIRICINDPSYPYPNGEQRAKGCHDVIDVTAMLIIFQHGEGPESQK
jgi:hypothetical protein